MKVMQSIVDHTKSNDSIKLPPGTSISDKWFNCNSCPAPQPPEVWKPSEEPPAYTPTQGINVANGSSGNENVKSKSAKLSKGAIIGIAVGCIVFVGLIVFIVIFIVLRRSKVSAPKPADITSEEVDTNFTSNQTNTTTNPLWAEDMSTTPNLILHDDNNNNNEISEDPFCKEFEEGY